MTKELVDKITMLEFKQELKEHLNNVTEVLNEAKEEIIRLTKENVELKDKLNFSTQYYQGEKAKKQLNESKELLARWLRLYKTNTVKGIITDTKQFLSEVGK